MKECDEVGHVSVAMAIIRFMEEHKKSVENSIWYGEVKLNFSCALLRKERNGRSSLSETLYRYSVKFSFSTVFHAAVSFTT